MGYGIIEKINSSAGGQKSKAPKKIKYLTCGVIETQATLLEGERLKKLESELNRLIKEYQPKVLAVERLYFFKNLKTVMPVSQAKGVVLLVAAKQKIPVFEFTPLQVKMKITGYGRAKKPAIQEKIKVLLKLKNIHKLDDAVDALGVAICCAQEI